MTQPLASLTPKKAVISYTLRNRALKKDAVTEQSAQEMIR